MAGKASRRWTRARTCAVLLWFTFLSGCGEPKVKLDEGVVRTATEEWLVSKFAANLYEGSLLNLRSEVHGRGRAALPALKAALPHSGSRASYEILAQLHPFASEVRDLEPILIAKIRDSDGWVRSEAATLAVKAGLTSPALVDALFDALGIPDPEWRGGGVDSALGTLGELVRPRLVVLVKNEEETSARRWAAASSLAWGANERDLPAEREATRQLLIATSERTRDKTLRTTLSWLARTFLEGENPSKLKRK